MYVYMYTYLFICTGMHIHVGLQREAQIGCQLATTGDSCGAQQGNASRKCLGARKESLREKLRGPSKKTETCF